MPATWTGIEYGVIWGAACLLLVILVLVVGFVLEHRAEERDKERRRAECWDRFFEEDIS